MKTPEAERQHSRLYEFGDFRLDTLKRLLQRRDGTVVPLNSRAFDTLAFLVQHSDTVLDKERLMEAVWPGSIVEENNLTQSISALRRALGERPDSHNFIVTVPGRGYRFVAAVKAVPQDNDHALAMEPARPRAEGAPASSPQPARLRAGFIAAALAIFLLGGIALLWNRGLTNHPAVALTNVVSEKSIAVLPFENLSDEKENSYFAAGVQNEILSDLAQIADLKVISQTSANLYQSGHPRNSREIGEQLGVAHLLEGSVQRVGGRIRVHAQLIDAHSDTHLWADHYDRDLADIFAIQSEIAQAIVKQLQVKISPGEKAAIAQAPTTDLIANALYAQAKELESQAPGEPLPDAVRLLEEAVARDPHFLLAYCMLGRQHLVMYWGGYDHTSTRRELANAAIQNAVHLQPDAGEVHLALACYAYHGFQDYDRARAELDLARSTLPNDVDVFYLTGAIDRRQGRWTEALRNLERAVELDPRNERFLLFAGGTYNVLRRYSEASRFFERAVAVSPRGQETRISLAGVPFSERADLRPLRKELSAILAEQPKVAEDLAEVFFDCAMAERDSTAVNRALALIPAKGLHGDNFIFPREWFAGVAARAFNDADGARASFTAARAIVEKIIHDEPERAPAWSLLGRIDAALERREEAVREGNRACELLPLSKDATTASLFIRNLAVIYAWTGAKDLALETLATSAQLPCGVRYGPLKLDPQWDSLRGDPRFEKIVASLAPKDLVAR